MNGRLVSAWEDVIALESAWPALLARSGFDDVFGSLQFYSAWWGAFGAGRALRVAVWPADGEPRIIAPMYFNLSAPKVWRLMGDRRGDYNHVLCAPANAPELPAFLAWLRREGGWSQLVARRLPPGSAFADYRESLAFATEMRNHPRLARPELTACRGKTESKHYRVERNWLQRSRPVRYERISGRDVTDEMLARFMELHAKEWRARGEESQFERADERCFFALLFRNLSATDAIHLDCLWWGDALIAAHVGFTWARREYYYKPCYDASLQRSPGKLLLGHLLERAAGDPGIEEFDFLNGLEPYKLEYASDVRRTFALDIYRSRVAYTLHRVRRRLAPGGS